MNQMYILVGFKNSIDRYLFERGYSASVCNGDEIKSSRSMLIAKLDQRKAIKERWKREETEQD